jgi:hypothetical protein
LNVYALLSIKMRSRKINFYFFAKCEKKLWNIFVFKKCVA